MQWGAATGLVALAGLAGCGDDDRWPPGRPRAWLEFAEQQPQSPQRLGFVIRFEDRDGDLGGGRLAVDLGDDRVASDPLAPLFSAQVPPVDLEAEEGRLELVVELTRELRPGERTRIAIELEDEAGNRSNRPWVELEARGSGGG